MIKKTEAKNEENDRSDRRKTAGRYVRREKGGGEMRDTSEKHRWNTMNGDIPFAVRYIKLVVECFESYHSHFDELARRIDRREDFAFCRQYIYLLNR